MGKIAGFVAVAMITLVAKAGAGSGDVEQVMRTKIDRRDDQIVQTIAIDDRPCFTSTFSYEPEDGGSSTRVKVDHKIDRAHIHSNSYARGNRKTAPMVDPSAVARAHVRGDSYDD